MKQKRWWNHCACVSVLLVGLGVQCFAYAAYGGFAVNKGSSSKAVYSANAADIVSQFLTDKQAKLLVKRHKDIKVVIAYNIDAGKTKSLTHLHGNNYIFYNVYGHVIGVGKTKEDAIALAQSPRVLYFARAGELLSDTIKRWGGYSNQDVFWDSKYDYRLQYSFAFKGELLSKGGALDQLLHSFANQDYSLVAEETQNNVLLIKDRTFRQKPILTV